MNFFNYKVMAILITSIATSAVNAQPAYYAPPPGYIPPANYNNAYPPPYYANPSYANPGFNNNGFRNGGYRNPAFNNSGYRNNGYRNNGYRNNGYRNNGFRPAMPFNNGPWNRFSNGFPGGGYGNNNNYGPDTRWFTDTPRRWMRNGPKEGAGQAFDDFLDAPSRMGDMPGGWSAPTISVPNPIDVSDELERGSQDMFNNN